MNKIYRVVWNETTQTWNAVAEFAKAHGKTASSGIGGIVAAAGARFAFTAIMSGLLLASGQVMADANTGTTLANRKAVTAAAAGTDYNTCYFDTTSYNVVCGDGNTSAADVTLDGKQGKSVALGQGAQTQGESNIAIGTNTRTAMTSAIAIGSSAAANHNQTIAIGQEASAKGQADIVIGKGAGPGTVSSTSRNIAIGENALNRSTNSENVIAIGTGAGADTDSRRAVYIGTDASGKGLQNVVVGYKAVSGAANGVSIGSNANTTGQLSTAIGSSALASGINVIAIGANSTGSGGSSIAIGGGQNEGQGARASGASSIALGSGSVSSNQRSISIGEASTSSASYSIAVGAASQATGQSNIAIGAMQNGNPTVAQGKFSIVMGAQAQVLGSPNAVENAIAIGSSSLANKANTIAFGNTALASGVASTAVGSESAASGATSTAVGAGSAASGATSTAVGAGSAASGATSTAVGAGSAASGEHASSFGYQANASAKGATALGVRTQASGLSSVAVGQEVLATANTATAIGQNSQAVANNAVAIGNKAVAQGTGNIVLGTNAGVYDPATIAAGRISGADTVLIGSDSGRNAYGNERQISIGRNTGYGAVGADNIAMGLRSGAFVNGANNVAIGKDAGQGTEAQRLNVTSTVAIGEAAKGSASNTVAVGKTANAAANETVAIGHNTLAAGVSAVALGQNANASGGEAVALGIDSVASGLYAVAIGNMAKVTDGKNNGIAIGSNATASQDYAIAVGLDTQAAGNSAIAFGNTAKALGAEAVAFGHLANAAKNNTVALGVSAASADVGAVTLGAYTKADAVTGTALGYSAHAVNENDVALGGDTLTEAHHNGDYTLNGSYTAAGTWSRGTVSVGKNDTANPGSSFTRQIQNVSAGVLSATSTDAVNGSQLYATNSYLLNLGESAKNALGGNTAIDGEGNLTLNDLGGTGANNVHDALSAMNTKIDQLGGGSDVHFYSVQTTADTRGNYDNDGATGQDALAAGADAAAAGDFAVAVGTGAQAGISNSIAIGKNATVAEDTASDAAVNGATKGEGSVAIGANTRASGTNATAVGQASNAYGQNSFAGGNSSKALGKSSVAVGDGATSTQDSASALGAYSQATAAGATALGFDNRATASGTVAAGRKSKAAANNAVALGNEADAMNDDTIAVGYKAKATANRAVAVGKNAQASAGDTFAFGDAAKATAGNAIAFGKNANAAHADAIALGAYSVTEAAVQTTSATVGSLTYGNFAGNAPASTLSIGAAGKERTITNVAAGRISATSTDAVNGSQLYATQNVVNNIGTTAAGVLGGNAAIGTDGTITMTNIGGTGASTVDGAISAINNASYKSFKLNTAKTSGTNGEATNHSLKEITSGSTITLEAGKNIVLNQNESTVSINTADAPEFAGKITAKGGMDMSNTKITNLAKGDSPTDAVNLSQLTDAINNVHVTTLTAITNEAPFAYISDDGRILKRNVDTSSGTRQVSFTYADDTNTAYNGNVTIAALNPTDPQTSTPTQIGNVAAGKAQNDAVNVSQLDKVAQVLGTSVDSATGDITAPTYAVISGSPATAGVANYNTVGGALTALSNAVRSPLSFAGDSGTASTRQLGSTVTVKGGEADEAKLSADNIGVVSDDATGTLNVKLAKELKGLTSSEFVNAAGGKTTVSADGITVGNAANPVKLTTQGLSNGGNKASDIAAGTAVADAVNVSQLTPLAQALGATVNPTTGAVEAPNLVVTQADGAQASPVNTVQGALDQIGTELQKGLVIAADQGSSEKINLGDTVKFTSKDQNIITTAGSGKAVDFTLANTITVGDKADPSAKPITIDGTKGTIAGLSDNLTALAAGGKTAAKPATLEGSSAATVNDVLNAAWNLSANGEAKDAVSAFDTLNFADGTGTAVTIDSSNGTNTVKVNVDAQNIVDSAQLPVVYTDASGSRVYKQKDGTFNTALNGSGSAVDAADVIASLQNAAGSTTDAAKLANVAEGKVSADSKEAVNGSQLYAAAAKNAQALGGGSTVGADGQISAPAYTLVDGTPAEGNAAKTYNSVGDALTALNTAVTAPLTFGGDNDDKNFERKLGSEVFVKGGADAAKLSDNNIGVVSDDTTGTLNVKLAKELAGLTSARFEADGNSTTIGGGSVTMIGKNGEVNAGTAEGSTLTDTSGNTTKSVAGSTELTDGSGNTNLLNAAGIDLSNNDGAHSAFTADGSSVSDQDGNKTETSANGIVLTPAANSGKQVVSLTQGGLDNGGNKIANVAKGEADTDAVNVAQLNETVAANAGRVESGNDNIVVETDKSSGFTVYKVATAADLTADSLTAGNTVVNGSGVQIGSNVALTQDGLKAGGVNITAAGINAGNTVVSNVAAGVADSDAVNVAQLKEQLAATEKTTTVKAGKNVTVSESVNGNNTEYTVNADKTTLSQAAGGAVKVSAGEKDADGVTDYALDLTDETKADLAKGVAAKDAVDNKGIGFAADNGATGAKKLGESVAFKGDGNILTRADENGIGFSLADRITLGKDGSSPIVLDGTAGLISGLTNTTLGGSGFATRALAATEEQLNAAQTNLAAILGGNAANTDGNVAASDIGGTGKDNIHDAIQAVKATADKGWNLQANDETSSENIAAGDTVAVKEGKNVKVSRTGKNITVATSDDLDVDSLTAGNTVVNGSGVKVGDNVALTQDGLKAGGVDITAAGINAGNTVVSNVAAGVADTDAVNVSQLTKAAAAATSKVESGNGNIVVASEQNADGSTTYKVATAANLTADSLTAGNTVVNDSGVKVGDNVALTQDGLKAGGVNITAAGINAGNTVVSNVAAGVADTDAVNVAQLGKAAAAAKTEIAAGTNIAGISSSQGANGQTVYTVNADGTSVSAASDALVVTKGQKDADNVTDYAVDLSQSIKADIAQGVAAKDAVDNQGIRFAGDSGTTGAAKLGGSVALSGDANITTAAGANGVQIGLNKDLNIDSVKAGDTVVNNSGVQIGNVAVGKDGINAGGSRITNVASGNVAADSTDAVNGGQLHQLYQMLGSNGVNQSTTTPSTDSNGTTGVGNITGITLVDNSQNPNVTNVTADTTVAQSNGYTLVTYNVEDQGMYVTNNVIEAVGRMNEQGIKFFHTNDGEVKPATQASNGVDSSASGAYATAVGYQAVSSGENGIAIGKGAQATAENTIAIGTGNIVSGRNSGAIGDPSVVSGSSSYSIGNDNTVSADNAYALGSSINATVNNSVYLGDRAASSGVHQANASAGEAYTYGGLNDAAVAGVAGSSATANQVVGVVAVGNNADETRQIQGVAAGVVSADSTDAVNGSQLYYTNQAINQSVTNIGNYVANMGNQINQRINNVENDSKAGTAAAMAVAGLPQAYLPGKSMMAVAGGTYRGESGYAVGFSSISDGGKWVIKGSASGNSRGHYGATAGVGYQW